MRGLFSKLAFLLVIFLIIGLFFGRRSDKDSVNDKRPIIGNAEKLKNTYENWKARATKNGAESKITLGLGYDKALSYTLTKARGQASLDLINGAFSVEVTGLNEKENYDVWLIDNIEGPKKSVKPEKGDVIAKIGTLKNDDGSLKLYNQIDPKKFINFKLDLVAVTPEGKAPSDSGLLFGSPSLFQRLYYSELRGEFANLNNKPVNPTDKSILNAPFSLLIPKPAIAAGGGMEDLLAEGEELFFEEPFGGNGRTCGTCHPFQNNFTIDPDFIATLSPDDPLFVAQNIPALANLENPVLMREFGLILENLDGFTNPGVMRGVPHTLGLPTSLEADTTIPLDSRPADMTGWSGDGAPTPGGIRNFATGAVIQHFPKTLNRIMGVDFILPTDDELDAMEAFQLSLGRQVDPKIPDGNPATNELVLSDPSATQGCVIIQNGNQPTSGKSGRCAGCHNNAGALNAQSENRNFLTGVEDLIEDPDVSTGEPRPRDGGFGQDPSPAGNCPAPPVGFGDNKFNAPPMIEAVDTPPFFHNNAVAGTIEDSIRFYNSPEFNDNCLNDDPSNPGTPGREPLGGEILLTDGPGGEVEQVGKCLRVLNSLENIRSSVEFLKKAFNLVNIDQEDANKAINASTFDLNDAIEVLADKGLHPNAVSHLMEALALAEEAQDVNNRNAKKSKIRLSVKKAVQAQNNMCTSGAVLCVATEL